MKTTFFSILMLLISVTSVYAENSKPVHVTNESIQTTVSNTVLTRRSKVPVNADVQFSMSPSLISKFNEELYTVPEGARLVIETVSFWTFTTNCAFFLKPSIKTVAGGENSEFRLPIPDRAFSPDSNTYTHSGTWPLKFYADPESTVTVSTFRTDNGCELIIRASIAGYLEPDE